MSFASVSIALALATAVLALSRRASLGARLALGLSAAAAAVVPLGGAGPAELVRGAVGELSITTLVLLGATALALGGGPDVRTRAELGALAGAVLLAGSFLYPLALGLTRFDPYALGYRGSTAPLLLGLSAVGLLAWIRRRWLLFGAIVLALAARQVELLESQNLWDYLLDPWLFLSLPLWAGLRFTIFDRLSKSR